MKYPFEASEQLIYNFEELLQDIGLTIQNNSDLEKVSLAILETNAKFKKEVIHDDNIDIRSVFSDVAGLIDIIGKVIKNRDHQDFEQIIPHLEILNKAGTSVMTSKSKVTDDGNNKLMELYISLLCMRFATNIELDNPNNSQGDNPDVMFSFRGKRWAIACKALHSAKEKTLYDTIEKGTEQINRSNAEKGIVVVNFKNIIDRDLLWPIINEDEYKNGEEPIFGCHKSLDVPCKMLQTYGKEYRDKVINLIGIEYLNKLSESGKCPTGFLIFLQAMTSVLRDGECPATILKTFNLVAFESIEEDYKILASKLNEAMHDLI